LENHQTGIGVRPLFHAPADERSGGEVAGDGVRSKDENLFTINFIKFGE